VATLDPHQSSEGLRTSSAVASVAAPGVMAAAARLPRKRRARSLLLASVICLLLASMEVQLRMLDPNLSTYAERTVGRYASQFTSKPTWFLVEPPGQPIRWEMREFTHARQVNSLGLPDAEFTIAKTPGEFRILALGDSFTEGIGTDAASTWVKVAERQLAARDPARRLTILNAGVSGSDPFFEFMLLKEKLRPLRPDLVVVALNETDVTEVVIRGGAERFRPDGTVAYRPAPRWEGLYARSYLVRLIVHGGMRYNWMLMSDEQLTREEKIAVQKLVAEVRSFREWCAADGCRLLVVAHPLLAAARVGRHPDSFAALVQRLGQEPGTHFVDLMPSYIRDGVSGSAAQNYFWPIDTHHNTRGYEVMGRAIAQHIWEAGLIAPPAARP
jgi:lysophospholipase L1-like esterase